MTAMEASGVPITGALFSGGRSPEASKLHLAKHILPCSVRITELLEGGREGQQRPETSSGPLKGKGLRV